MCYRSGTDGRCCTCIGGHYVLTQGGSTLLHEMTSWPPSWKCDVKSKIQLRPSMCICWKTFMQISLRSDLKGRSLGFFWRCRPKKNKNKNKNKMSQRYETSSWVLTSSATLHRLRQLTEWGEVHGQSLLAMMWQFNDKSMIVGEHEWQKNRTELWRVAAGRW